MRQFLNEIYFLSKGREDFMATSEILGTDSADAAVVNTITATNVFTRTIAATALSLSQKFRINLWGSYKQNGVASSNLTIEIKLGSTTLWKDTKAISQHNRRSAFELALILSARSATNVQKLHGFLLFGDNSAAPTNGIGDWGAPSDIVAISGDATEDNSAPLSFDVEVTWGNANVAIDLTVEGSVSEYLA